MHITTCRSNSSDECRPRSAIALDSVIATDSAIPAVYAIATVYAITTGPGAAITTGTAGASAILCHTGASYDHSIVRVDVSVRHRSE